MNDKEDPDSCLYNKNSRQYSNFFIKFDKNVNMRSGKIFISFLE